MADFEFENPVEEIEEKEQTYLKRPWSSNQTFMKGENLLDIKTPDTKTSLYLYNINTKKEMNIKLIPDSLAEAYSPNIITESPFGVLHPINFYTGGSPKTISFSFDIHEDMITAMGISKTLYRAMDILKSMSEPMVKNDIYKEPAVYLQLGDQFAGKGHMSSKISFGKPFVDGRYKMASVQIDFTYHELYKNDSMKQLFKGSSTITSDFALDETPSGYASIEDFYTENLDYDYMITGTIFSDKKQETFWDFVVSELITDRRLGKDIPATTMQSLIGAISDVSVDKSFLSDITSIPWLNDILVVYAELFDLLSSAKLKSYSTVYYDLGALEILVYDINIDFQDSNHPYSTNESGIGWYVLPGGGITQANEEIQIMIENEIDFLDRLIDKLQESYAFLSNKASD